MSTASERLTVHCNHLQNNNMAAASNYFSVVAGVGAGTGMQTQTPWRNQSANHRTGRSVALKFAKAYPVVLLARNPANYEEIVKEIKASGGQAVGFPTDVASQSSVKDAFAQIKKEFGSKKLAAAVFNVGGSFVRKPFLEMSLEEYEAGYNANGYG
jgi:hypothetical protein